jgi:hypothetical protein
MVTAIRGRAAAVVRPTGDDVLAAPQGSTRRPFTLERRSSPSAPRPSAPGRTEPLRRLTVQLERQRSEIDRAIADAARGKTFTPTQLIMLQAKVYAFSQSMEVVSHMVDRVVGAVKTTLNTQI